MLLKLLLPQKFEKMAMQDLRALVAERSTTTIYIRGEFIEIPYHSIGFLLEGFVKTQGIQEELITSPAPLLPSHGYQSFQNLEMLGNIKSCFKIYSPNYILTYGILIYMTTTNLEKARVIITGTQLLIILFVFVYSFLFSD